MPHILFMCMGLIGVLFTGAAMGLAYAQMKLDDPLDDGYFQVRRRFAERLGLGGWAGFEQTRFVRILSFGVTGSAFLACVAVTIWQAILAFA